MLNGGRCPNSNMAHFMYNQQKQTQFGAQQAD